MEVNNLTPLLVFIEVQDILFHDLQDLEVRLGAMSQRQSYFTVLEQSWDDVAIASHLFFLGQAFSPLSMLTSVRGHGDVSCM